MMTFLSTTLSKNNMIVLFIIKWCLNETSTQSRSLSKNINNLDQNGPIEKKSSF